MDQASQARQPVPRSDRHLEWPWPVAVAVTVTVAVAVTVAVGTPGTWHKLSSPQVQPSRAHSTPPPQRPDRPFNSILHFTSLPFPSLPSFRHCARSSTVQSTTLHLRLSNQSSISHAPSGSPPIPYFAASRKEGRRKKKPSL